MNGGARKCGHPLGTERWCPECELAQLRPLSRAVPAIGADAVKAAVLDSIEWPKAHEYFRIGLLEWAVSRWRDEVQHRPLVNVHRRTLDDTWRQVIRHAGGDPDSIIGPSHDALIAAAPAPSPAPAQPPMGEPALSTKYRRELVERGVAKLRELREHVPSADCWCQPEASYTDPETGVTVFVHRKPQ